MNKFTILLIKERIKVLEEFLGFKKSSVEELETRIIKERETVKIIENEIDELKKDIPLDIKNGEFQTIEDKK